VDAHRLDRLHNEELEQHRESAPPTGASPALSCRLPWTHQRMRSIPPTSLEKKRQGACFFKVQFVSLAIVNFKPPMNELPFKTADVQGQSQKPNFQNLSIRILMDFGASAVGHKIRACTIALFGKN